MMREVALVRRPGVPQALPAPALRRPAAAHRSGDGVRQPAAPDRPRRADHRPRRDDAVDRARRPCATSPRRTTSRRSTSPTTSPSWRRVAPPRRGHVRRTHRRARPRRQALRVLRRTPTRVGWSVRSRAWPAAAAWSASPATRPRPASARVAAPSRRAAPCASTSARRRCPTCCAVAPDHESRCIKALEVVELRSRREYGDPVALPPAERRRAVLSLENVVGFYG